jgi:hypothetical protein
MDHAARECPERAAAREAKAKRLAAEGGQPVRIGLPRRVQGFTTRWPRRFC